jgi:hypothetical protein
MKHTTMKAKTLPGKLHNKFLSLRAKWAAMQTTTNPGIMYPLAMTMYTKSEIPHLDKIKSQMSCHALGLNRDSQDQSYMNPPT